MSRKHLGPVGERSASFLPPGSEKGQKVLLGFRILSRKGITASTV